MKHNKPIIHALLVFTILIFITSGYNLGSTSHQATAGRDSVNGH